MTYEIPQSLQYKERVVFNLTIEQFVYAAVAGLLAFLIYAKLPLVLSARIILASIPIAIAVPFMYFDLWNKISDLWGWYRFRQCSMFNPALKKYLQLLAVEQNCYHLQTKQGVKRVAVLSVEPLNFGIKPKDERDSIMYAFQKLLNSLDFPIQLTMYTEDLDLGKYLSQLGDRVRKAGSAITRTLFDAHGNYLDGLMKERPASNRKFYVVVPESAMGLVAQVRIIDEMLQGMNLKTARLSGRLLINILIKFFANPRGRTDLLKKDKSLYNIVAPEFITNKPNHIKVNEYYNQVVAAVGYPRVVEAGFLDKIVTASGNFDLSIHIEPFPIETTMITLNKELQKQRADLYAAELKHSFQPSLEIQYADTKGVLDSIQKGQEKLFNVSLYINAKAKSVEELDVLSRTIQSQLNSILIIPKVPKYRMAQGLKSMLPFGLNALGIRRNITTQALSSFFPFTSPFLILEKGGVFLGLNKNRLPIIKDVFSLSNANGAILATSGSGKSYAAKLLISRYLTNGTKVIVIDPQDEYSKLTEKYGGSVITISKNSSTMINPLDLLDHEYSDKRLALLDLFNIMFGQLNESQRAVLDKAVTKTYADFGIGPDDYIGKVPPTLSDLYVSIEKLSKDANVYERGSYTMLLNRLSMYVDGSFSFMNRQTNIDIDKDFVTFNIGSMPKQVKPVMMFLILEYIYARMKHDRNRKLLVIDEAWSMLQHAQEQGYVFEIVKTCRKWNLGLLLITQDVADLLNSNAGRAVLANTSYTVLLRQKAAIMRSVESVFNLSFAEREHLLSANVGEGILMMENDHQEIKVMASAEEHNLITTKPDELIVERPDIPVDTPLNARKLIQELDLECDVYKSSTLHPSQDEFLRKNNFQLGKHIHPYEHGFGRYHVKKRGNEGQPHVFLSWIIYQELLNYSSKVRRIYISRQDLNPDIVFTNEKGEEVAIEVETGSNHKYHYEYLQQKFRNLDSQYPNRWCVFLTNAQYKPRYETMTNAPVMLRKHVRRFLQKQFPSGVRVRSNATPILLPNIADDKKKVVLNPEKP